MSMPDPIRSMRVAAAMAAAEAATGFDASVLLPEQIAAMVRTADAALIAGLRAVDRFVEFGSPGLSRSPHILAADIEAQARGDGNAPRPE